MKAQKEEFGQLREELGSARGRPAIVANVLLKADDGAGEWTTTQEEAGRHRGAVLDTRTFADNGVWVMIHVINPGAEEAEVLGAGLLLADETGVDARNVHCIPPEQGPLAPCEFPLKLEPQGSRYIYVDVEASLEFMVCNRFVERHGIVAAIRTGDGRLVQADTGTDVAQSDAC